MSFERTLESAPLPPEVLDAPPQVTCRVATAEEEWQRVSGYLSNYSWYRVSQYQLAFPDHPSFAQQIAAYHGKGDGSTPLFMPPQPERLAKLETIFHEQVYEASAYEAGLQAVEAGRTQLEQLFPIILEHQKLWGFTIPSEGYEIVLTRYGTTGSYNSRSDPGRLTMRHTGTESGAEIAERTAHEMIHIGLQWLVSSFGLDAKAKESLIDAYFRIHLPDLFPDYEAQGPYVLEYALPYNADIRDILRRITFGQYDIPERPEYYRISLSLERLDQHMRGPLTPQNSRYPGWKEWLAREVPEPVPPHLRYDLRHMDPEFFGSMPHGPAL